MRLVHTRDFNLQLMSFGGGDGEIKTPGILSKPDIGKWGTDKRVHQQQSEKNKCTEYFLFEERERESECGKKHTTRCLSQ